MESWEKSDPWYFLFTLTVSDLFLIKHWSRWHKAEWSCFNNTVGTVYITGWAEVMEEEANSVVKYNGLPGLLRLWQACFAEGKMELVHLQRSLLAKNTLKCFNDHRCEDNNNLECLSFWGCFIVFSKCTVHLHLCSRPFTLVRYGNNWCVLSLKLLDGCIYVVCMYNMAFFYLVIVPILLWGISHFYESAKSFQLC